MDKRIISLVWALAALTGVVAVRFPLASASSLIEVSVSPQSSSASVGQSFSVNITIANVPSPGLFSYQFSLYYDNAILQCIAVQIPSDHFLKPMNPSNIFIVDPGTINQSAGCVTFVLTLLGNELGKIGSGVLATVQFTGLAAGISLLELRESGCILVDSNTNQIPSSQYQLRSGSISVGSAGMQVFLVPWNNSVSVGQSFSVNIDIADVPSPGVYAYQFSLYYNGTILQGISAQIPSDHFLKPISPDNISIVDPGTINQSQGRVSFALTLLGNELGKTGGGVLATVQFTGSAVGTSLLELRGTDVILVDPSGNRIAPSQYQLTSGGVDVESGSGTSGSGTSDSLGVEVFLSPESNFVSVGQSFSVNVSITNVTSLGVYSYQFSLHYDGSVLQCVGVQIPSDHFLEPMNPSNIFILDPGTINQSAGCVTFALTLLGNEPGKTGGGVLASVQFTGLAAGISLLELKESDWILVDSDTNLITLSQYQLRSGSVSVSGPAGMALFLSPESNFVSVGQSFSVDVNIANVPSPGVCGYQFSLCYDSAVLQCVGAQVPSDHFLEPMNPSNIFIIDPGTINQSQGRVSFALTLLGNELGKIGSGVLASVQFTGLAAGISLLELRDVYLMDSNSSQFPTDQYSLGQGSIKVVQQISIADYDVSFGSDVTVESVVEGASTIAGASFDIYFNKSVVNAVSVSSGDFGAPVYVIDNDAGIVKISTVGVMAVGKDVATLAKITFHGISGGSTPLQLQNAHLNDEKGNTIAPLTRDGSIFVHNPQITISSCYTDVGSTVNVSIVVLNAENVAGGSMNMTFDTSVINVVCVFPGDFGMPIVDIRNNESTVSLTFASASAVGRPNATLAVLSCTGMSKGITFFHVENAELNDEQGNLVIPKVFEQGSSWGSLGVPPGVPGVPEFQPIGILLVCLLLGSIAVVMRKKLLGKRSALPRIQKQ